MNAHYNALSGSQSKRDTWIGAPEFAMRAGISERMARQALARAHEGKPWRCHHLNVRIINGRGGKGGHQYQVSVDSLPPELQKVWLRQGVIKAADDEYQLSAETPSTSNFNPTPAPPGTIRPALPALLQPLRPGDKAPLSRITGGQAARELASWKLSIIQPIRLETEAGTSERKGMIESVGATAFYPDGKKRGQCVGASTIRAWIKAYEAHGLEGLARKARSDARKRRVIFSKKLDALVTTLNLSASELSQWEAAVRRYVRSQWASGVPSWPTVQMNTAPMVMNLLRGAGCAISDAELLKTCQLPRTFIEDGRLGRAVAIRRKDAGRSAAIQTPRIKRDRSHLKPGDFVAGDVHHIDIILRRDDGSLCTPKMVAWLDLATNRAFTTLVLVPKGQMIRTEHVIQSFVDMCSDPDWGCPTAIYIDNGSEYIWTKMIGDICKLKRDIKILGFADAKRDLGIDLTHRQAAGVITAKTYTPQSKVIETLFSILEKAIFAQIEGHIGGDRMKKKVENQGKAPSVYPGSFEDFKDTIRTAIEYYHLKPQKGHLAGQSPRDRFMNFCADGWQSITLDRDELAVAFSTEEMRKVKAGGKFDWRGKVYRHDALNILAGIGAVTVREPLFGDKTRLYLFSDDGDFLGIPEPEQVFRFDDPAGAIEQQRQVTEFNRQIRAIEQETDKLKPEDAMVAAVAANGPAAKATSAGRISINPDMRRAAEAARTWPSARADADDQAGSVRKMNEIYDRVLRGRGNAA